MNRLDDGKYAILLRDDYLPHIHRVSGGRERDSCIQQAIEEYVALPEDVQDRETERQRVSITSWSGAEREYHMLLDQVFIPDDVVETLRPFDRGDLERNINTAIRLWLLARGVEGLEP